MRSKSFRAALSAPSRAAVLATAAALLAGGPAAAVEHRPAKPGHPSAATANKNAPKPAQKARRHAAVRGDDAPDVVTYGRRDDVMAFADEVAQRQALDPDWVRAQLASARYLPTVARLIMPPPAGSAKNWAAYRARFVESQRIGAGLRFWQQHEAALARAEAEYGVPAAIVVGIIGVETFYGRMTGGFRVVDALATLAFDFPTGRKDRTPFFRGELEELLRWCGRGHGAPDAPQAVPVAAMAASQPEPAPTAAGGCELSQVRGSYAGAIGLPQFMPGSINRHAIDFDGDGRIDLSGSPVDAIGSVARYLADFGWQRGQPTHYEVAPPTDTSGRATLLAPDILPSFTPAQMAEQGAVLGDDALRHAGPLALVELQNGGAAPSYVAGTANFYAVTRYNWSSYYALAVIELGQAVEAARRAAPR